MRCDLKLGIIFIAGLLIVLGVRTYPQDQNNVDKAHQQWLEERYKEATSIKPGMTRSDLLKLFWRDGGFQSATEQRFVLKSCHLIKIEVRFDKYDFANKQPDDSIRIVEVSRPYLQPMALD